MKVTTDWLQTSEGWPVGFIYYYNTSTIAPGENDTIPIEVKYVLLTGTGEFTFTLMPSFLIQYYEIYRRYHEINVGPLFDENFIFIETSLLDTKPILDDLYDDQKCHIYIPIVDEEDDINETALRLYFKGNGNASYESVGLTSTTLPPTGTKDSILRRIFLSGARER